MIFATADGLQATAGTGAIAVGDYVVAGTATVKRYSSDCLSESLPKQLYNLPPRLCLHLLVLIQQQLLRQCLTRLWLL